MPKRKKGSASGITLGSADGISTGWGLINFISGNPAFLFPFGSVTEVSGLKSASKTTLILETIAFNQMINPDFKVLYTDFEKMLLRQKDYLLQLGVDVDNPNFIVKTPDTMEDGMKIIHDAVRSDEDYDMIVVDSVAAMRPKRELEVGLMENKQMGLKAKAMSEFLRNLTADMPEDNPGPAVVFINQLYKDITAQNSFVQQYVTPSSDALAFYAAVRIEVRESTKVKEKKVNPFTFEETDSPIGSIVAIKTTKNKVGIPFQESKYMITYGIGIDVIPSIIAAAQRSGAIYMAGASKSAFRWIGADGTEQGANGVSALTRKLRENIDDLIAIGSKINDLWASDLKHLKARLERKRMSDNPLDMYEASEGDSEDDEEGDALELGGGMVDLNKPSIIDPETTETDISAIVNPKVTTPPVQRATTVKDKTESGEGLKLNLN
jgi:protein RecA